MTSSALGMLISVIFKYELAVIITPVLILPFHLFSGFLINLNNIPRAWTPLIYLSYFKYGYQAAYIVYLKSNF